MTIHIFGGGTVQHVRNHMALCTPAYGNTARQLFALIGAEHAQLHLTKMADYTSKIETNEDVLGCLLSVLEDPATTAVVFNVALCDYSGQIGDVPSGKYAQRLSSREGDKAMRLTPTPKLLQQVKLRRPDVLVVGFKTTANMPVFTQVRLARRQIDETGADWVLANDTVTRNNVLVSDKHAIERSREALLQHLADFLKG